MLPATWKDKVCVDDGVMSGAMNLAPIGANKPFCKRGRLSHSQYLGFPCKAHSGRTLSYATGCTVRVVLLHNRYRLEGGEDTVVANEKALLEEHGHKVKLVCVSNDALAGIWAKAKTAWQSPYSYSAKMLFANVLADFKPDVVHAHNLFPLLTPSVYDAARNARTPVVQTLHNYRTICPGALLLRDGKVCEKCVTGSAYQAVWHGCYRKSRLGTFAVARMLEYQKQRHTWRRKVDRFIALTQFSKNKFIKGGFPAKKIVVKPNYHARDGLAMRVNGVRRSGALFVGRLSPEKGVATLVRAFRSVDVPLRVVGDGPLRNVLKQSGLSNVISVGTQTPQQVGSEMLQAAFLVMPSECYEGFPMVLVEAFAHGLPVLTSRLGSMAEIVEDTMTGLHFEAGDAKDLSEKTQWMHHHPEECRRMGKNARLLYENRYTPQRNYEMLTAIYQEAINDYEKSND